MKFTLARADLESLLKAVVLRPQKREFSPVSAAMQTEQKKR
jgi:hypothetical protein